MNTHPEKWYIQLTPENHEEVKAWWLKQVEKSGWVGRHLYNSYAVLSKHPWDGSFYWSDGGPKFKKAFPSYQEITLEQFRAITNPLPEHWYIEVTEENIEELNRWRLSKRTTLRWDNEFVPGAILLSKHPQDESYFWNATADCLTSTYPEYKPITLEQFRQITNSAQTSMTKTIKISHSLLIEYYEAATTPQKEYLTKHFKLDGTTTEEAIRGLYELACGGWKPKIKANHPECFPEESKYFDFSEHTNQYGFDSIVSSHIAHSLGLCRNFIQVRNSDTKNSDRSFYLTSDYNWELVKDGGAMVLIPTKKVK